MVKKWPCLALSRPKKGVRNVTAFVVSPAGRAMLKGEQMEVENHIHSKFSGAFYNLIWNHFGIVHNEWSTTFDVSIVKLRFTRAGQPFRVSRNVTSVDSAGFDDEDWAADPSSRPGRTLVGKWGEKSPPTFTRYGFVPFGKPHELPHSILTVRRVPRSWPSVLDPYVARCGFKKAVQVEEKIDDGLFFLDSPAPRTRR